MVLVVAGVLIFGATLAYFTYNPWREEIDEIYSTVYLKLFVDPAMNAVATKQSNIAYCGTQTRLQRLDLYRPKNIDTPAPVVMYIHGGGWTGGDKVDGIVASYGTELVRNGMALVSINYRFAPAATYPAQNQDVECALTYLTAHAAELHVDMTKVGLFGDSAGGQLAAMTAFESPHKSQIKAVTEFYAPSDILAQINRKPRSDTSAIKYIGTPVNEALARQASPLYANHDGAPPFLIFHGTNDHTVHYDQSVRYVKKLQEADVNVTLKPVAHADHYFGLKSSPNRDAIEKEVVTFFKKYLLF